MLSTVDIPVIANTSLNSLNIIAFQLRLTFNSAVIQPISLITSGTLLNSYGTVNDNLSQKNYINIAVAGTGNLTGKGILFYVRFKILSSGYTGISFSSDGAGLLANNFINEGTTWGTLKNGSVNIQAKPVIYINPNTGLLAKGDQLQFTVSNGTSPYSWTLTDNTVASINTTGLLTGLKAGTIHVIAKDAHNVIDTSGIVEVRSLKISIPQNLQQYPRQFIDVPVNVTDLTGLGIISGNFNINYGNASWLSLVGFNNTGTLLAGNYQLFTNNSQDVVNFAFSGTTPLSGNGVLIYIRFKVLTSGFR